jgi:hypothetical protein
MSITRAVRDAKDEEVHELARAKRLEVHPHKNFTQNYAHTRKWADIDEYKPTTTQQQVNEHANK